MRGKIYTIVGLLFYRISYEIIYAKVTSVVFSGLKLYYDPIIWKCILSYEIFFILIFLPSHKDTIMKDLMNIYLVFTIIPLLSMFWQANRSLKYILMVTSCYSIMHIGCCSVNPNKASDIKLGDNIGKIRVDKFLIIIALIGILLLTFRYGGVDFRALDLANVYSVRSEKRFIGGWGYIINWLSYAIVPCSFCLSLYYKSKTQFVISAALQLYLFLFTGSKTILFSLGLVLFSYMLIANKKQFIFYWSMFLSFIIITCTLFYKITNIILPFGIFPVRLLSVPANISNNHYEFFSENKKLYFAENFLGKLFDIKSPYNIRSSYLVSTGTSNNNTGLVGDAYANGGFIVMIIYSLLFIVVFRYIERVYNRSSKGYGVRAVYVGVLTYAMIYLNDGSFTSLLITGGLLIEIMVFLSLKGVRRDRGDVKK